VHSSDIELIQVVA